MMSQGGKDVLPATMQYFKKIGERLNNSKASDFDDNSLLSPEQIVDTVKRVEAIGIDEVILYFNFGKLPRHLCAQMHRFTKDIAPAFGCASSKTTSAAE